MGMRFFSSNEPKKDQSKSHPGNSYAKMQKSFRDVPVFAPTQINDNEDTAPSSANAEARHYGPDFKRPVFSTQDAKARNLEQRKWEELIYPEQKGVPKAPSLKQTQPPQIQTLKIKKAVGKFNQQGVKHDLQQRQNTLAALLSKAPGFEPKLDARYSDADKQLPSNANDNFPGLTDKDDNNPSPS